MPNRKVSSTPPMASQEEINSLRDATTNFGNAFFLTSYMLFGWAPSLVVGGAMFMNNRIEQSAGNPHEKNLSYNPIKLKQEVNQLQVGTVLFLSFGLYKSFANNKPLRAVIAGLTFTNCAVRTQAMRIIP